MKPKALAAACSPGTWTAATAAKLVQDVILKLPRSSTQPALVRFRQCTTAAVAARSPLLCAALLGS